jgi:phytoene desaturase
MPTVIKQHQKNIIVIGSGFGGLSAAVRLAAAGHRVTIFEKRDQLGGRGYQYQLNGFKFDGGPTVITAPYMFDEVFAAAGRKREDYFQLVPLDPFYRVFDENAQHFDYRHRLDDMLSEIHRWNPDDVEGYKAFVKHTEKIFHAFYPFTDKAFLRLTDMLKIMPDVIRMGLWQDMYGYASRFIKHEFLRRVFSFHPLLIGGNPLDTPSIFGLIIQFEKEWGVHYAVGGTGAIVAGFGKLFQELGGRLHLGAEVKEIILKDKRATGVLLANGERYDADIVVCNGDYAFAYRHLIPTEARSRVADWRIDTTRYSCSLMVIYFGTKRRYLDSKFHHHNIIVGSDYKRQLREIFDGHHLPKDLSLYLHMPTLTDPSIAPEGCESFYVLALVPNLRAQIDWHEQGQRFRDRVMQFLEDRYLPNLQANIIAEHRIDPLHFQHTLNSFQGAAFAAKPTLLQSAWLRPHNRSDDFENLYFVGAGTHPGAGVPAVFASGKIAADLIEQSVRQA